MTAGSRRALVYVSRSRRWIGHENEKEIKVALVAPFLWSLAVAVRTRDGFKTRSKKKN
jgi:hypothetical protein